MPGFDRTGPDGKGSRTGRELGKCNTDKEKSVNEEPLEDELPRGRKFGFGFGFGRGRGRGNRRGFRRGD